MVWMYVRSVSHMDNDENSPNSVEMPLSDEKFSQLQVGDEKIKNLRVRVSNVEYSDFYKIENNILYRRVVENNHKFDAAVLPAELINYCFVSRAQPEWTQWFPENICSNQKNLLLEGYVQGYFKILQRLFTVHKTLGGEEKVHRTILQAWCTTNGIYFHGLGW